MPDSRLTIYEEKAHGMYITEAKPLNEDVLAFIRRCH
jgi:hypothetical protein